MNWVVIRVKLEPFEAKNTFYYLRHTVNFNNINCEDLYSNLWKAQIQWGLVAMFLEKTGAPVKDRSMIYKAVVQAVVLSGSNLWVVMDPMTNPDAIIRYKRSDIILWVRSDASYLSCPKAQSRVGGMHFLSNKPP